MEAGKSLVVNCTMVTPGHWNDDTDTTGNTGDNNHHRHSSCFLMRVNRRNLTTDYNRYSKRLKDG